MKTFIQLTTGLIIQFDINESPYQFNSHGHLIIRSGIIFGITYQSSSRTVENLSVNQKHIVCNWDER